MEDKIKDLVEKAESIIVVANISDDLRIPAFKEVIRFLLQTESGAFTQPVVKNKDSILDQNINKRKPKERINSPASLIEKMIDDGYFQSKRNLIECQNQLKIAGFNISSKQLSTVLLRKVRSGRLKREILEGVGYVYFS